MQRFLGHLIIIFQAWGYSSGLRVRAKLRIKNQNAAFGLFAGAEIRNSTCGLCGGRYLAGPGDSVASVAARCNISVSEIRGPNLPPDVSGTEIKIPCNNSGIGCGICGESYTVRYGDTLSAIAEACGMDLPQLEGANPDIDFENIFSEQLIRVPCRGAPPLAIAGCGACGFRFTVQAPGDSLAGISGKCGAPAEEILGLNPRVNFSGLVLGQRLRMPCGSPRRSCGPCGDSFTVPAAGESNRESVAAKCRLGFMALTELNPGVDSWETLKPGMILQIPCTNPAAADDHLGRSGCLCNASFTVGKNSSTAVSVGEQCNVSAAAISYANNVPVNGSLTAGQRLKIPCGEAAPDERRGCSICGSSVRPSAAVDLVSVAKACGVTVGGIQLASNTSLVSVGMGDVVRVPCEDEAAGCGPCGIAYRAEAGDDVSTVAVRCSTMIPEIEGVNPGVDFEAGIGGRVIRIPCLSSGSTALWASSSLTAAVVWLLAVV